jgi:hypothetical protein
MKKIFFSLGVFNSSDYRYDIFNNQIKQRNLEYCNHHGFEYLHINDVPLYRNHYSWSRLKFAETLIDGLKDGDIITNIDADMCIVDGKISFQTDKSFAYSIDTGNSHCLGSWTLRVNDWSRQFIKNLLSEELFKKYHNDSLIQMWKEQGIFYYITGIKKPDGDCEEHFNCFNQKLNYGFNEFDYGETLYTTNELLENIEILSQDWNVSYQEGEKYFICKNEKIIIRHWSGSIVWEPKYYNNPIIF